MLTAIVFWGSTLILGWVYAGYPASVAVLARVRPVKLRPTLDPPSLTVAIAVHDEARITQ